MILVFDTSEDRDKFVILYETYGKTIYYTLSRYNLDELHFTELSGRHSVLERPLSEVNGRLFFS